MQDAPSSLPDMLGPAAESSCGNHKGASSMDLDPARFSTEVAEALSALLKVSIHKMLRQENAALIKKLKQVFQEELLRSKAAPGSATPTQVTAHGDSSIHVVGAGRRVSFSPSENSAGTQSRSLESIPSNSTNVTDVKTLQMHVADKILGAKSLMGALSHTRVFPQDEIGGQHDSVVPGVQPSNKNLAANKRPPNLKHLEQTAHKLPSEPSSPKAPTSRLGNGTSAEDEKLQDLGGPASKRWDCNQADNDMFQMKSAQWASEGNSPKRHINAGVASFGLGELNSAGGTSRDSADFAPTWTASSHHSHQIQRAASECSGIGSPSSRGSISPSASLRVEDMQRLRSAELTDRLRQYSERQQTIETLGAIPEAIRNSGVTNSNESSQETVQPDQFTMPFVMAVCGVLPWTLGQSDRIRSWFLWYQILVVLLAIMSCAALVHQVIEQPEMCSKHPVLTDVPLAAGGALSLISLTSLWGQSSAIHDSYLLLYTFAEREEVLRQLQRYVGWDSVVMVLLWLAVVLERMRTGGFFCAVSNGTLHSWEVLPVIAFAISTGLIMGASFCILHVSRGMSVLIDRFCLNAMHLDRTGIIQCVSTWNVLQAVIRKLSGVLERCFFLVQAVAALIVLLSVIDTLRQSDTAAADLEDLIPGVLVMGYILRIFFAAVQVTDKSLRVAPLIVSLYDGDSVDSQRQFVVQQIVSSAAGFYVFDVCLTTSMAFKFTYFCGVVFLGLVARVVSSTEY